MKAFPAALAAVALLSFASPSAAQTYPDRTITVIVPYAPGGNTDVIARIVLEGMTQIMGQRFIIENIGGAGGTTGSQRGARATPDGYTLLVGQMGTHAASVGLYGDRLGYDPLNDFEHVTQFTDTPIAVFVKKDSTGQDIARPRRRAENRCFQAHQRPWRRRRNLACELPVIHVAGRRTCADARLSRVGAGAQRSHHRAIRFPVRPDPAHHRACRSRQRARARHRANRTLARAAECADDDRGGLPQLQASGWNAMFAPKGTPKAVVDKLADAANKALDDPKTRKRLEDIGAIVPPPANRGPQALRNFVAAEIAKWTPVIKAAGAAIN